MEFKNVSAELLPRIAECVSASGCLACDFTPVNLFIWRNIFKNEIALEKGFLFRRSFTSQGSPRYTFPLGAGDPAEALELILEDSRRFGAPLCFSGLTDGQLETVLSRFPEKEFELVPRRDRADYIYSAEALATLSGKKYHAKRNFINRFTQKYGDSARISPITPGDIPEILEYSRHWCEANGCRHGEGLEKEACAISDALANWEMLGLFGAVLRIDGRVCAFNFASHINPTAADVHVEKAEDSIEGCYAVINNALAKMLAPKYRYLNREEDMDLPGLRQAKLSYRPEILLTRTDAREKP